MTEENGKWRVPSLVVAKEKLQAYLELPNRADGGAIKPILEGRWEQETADRCVLEAGWWSKDWGGTVHYAQDREITVIMQQLSNYERFDVWKAFLDWSALKRHRAQSINENEHTT